MLQLFALSRLMTKMAVPLVGLPVGPATACLQKRLKPGLRAKALATAIWHGFCRLCSWTAKKSGGSLFVC